MKILHYSLGFPPYRTGGLTKFCMDLMKQQIQDGQKVELLWPGEMSFIRIRTKIKDAGYVDGIKSWEIINPAPVSYDEGIREVEQFTKTGDLKCYENFLEMVMPDVIHVHTLMGLHSSFLMAARRLNIRIVFSTHDYFPICPKVTMFREGHICDSVSTCEKCMECNTSALSVWKIKFLQSHLYRNLKNTSMVKKLRKGHRDAFLSGENLKHTLNMNEGNSNIYLNLRKYYLSMVDYVDIIHYNSDVTKCVYENFLDKHRSEIISITHADIRDNRKIKKFLSDRLRITYLGPYSIEKGFFMLKAALDELWEERQDFCLNVFFQMSEKIPYIITHDRYEYKDLDKIFDDTDVLIAPSIWYETFGFTVLEALSYGVPVIVSDKVGAKDIIPDKGGVIIDDISAEKLFNVIRELNIEILHLMNESIINKGEIQTLKSMSDQIMIQCYGQ